jgi:ABC-type transporter Mla MlaB component
VLGHRGRLRDTSGGPRITPLTDRPGLCLCGELDLASRDLLVAALESLADAPGDVHLDLAGVGFVDVGCATLLARAACRGGSGRRVIVHHAPPQLRRIVEVLWGGSTPIEMGAR